MLVTYEGQTEDQINFNLLKENFMFIESIELKNYRNYEELHMELSQGTNILYGDNAQGKDKYPGSGLCVLYDQVPPGRKTRI